MKIDKMIKYLELESRDTNLKYYVLCKSNKYFMEKIVYECKSHSVCV